MPSIVMFYTAKFCIYLYLQRLSEAIEVKVEKYGKSADILNIGCKT